MSSSGEPKLSEHQPNIAIAKSSVVELAIAELIATCKPVLLLDVEISPKRFSATRLQWREILRDASLQNSYESELIISQNQGEVLFCYGEAGEILLSRSPIALRVWIDPEADPGNIATLLRTHFLALVLELNGVLVSHGSAIAIASDGYAFLAPTGTGKSSLCAAALIHGARFLSDDLVPLAFRSERLEILPVQSPLKLRPGTDTDYLLERITNAEVCTTATKLSVNPGMIASQPTQAKALFLLKRSSSSDLEISPTNGQLALLAILENLFIPKIITALGIDRARFELAVKIASQLRCFELKLPASVAITETILRTNSELIFQSIKPGKIPLTKEMLDGSEILA